MDTPSQHSEDAAVEQGRIVSPASSRARSQGSRRHPRRYGFACHNCRVRKVKCTGEQPICRACQRSGSRCTWKSSTEQQLRDANWRIQQLKEAVVSRPTRTRRSLRSSIVDRDSPRSEHAARGNTSETQGTIPETSPGTSAWFQVGLGHNGAVTYHGPTSRFHAEALGDHADDDDGSSVSGKDTGAAIRRASHVDALRCQYDLLDTVWSPLIASKSSLDGFGINTSTRTALLDIYWTWLQPLHNCVYRPCFMMDMAIGGPCYSEFLLVSIFALSARHLSEQPGQLFHGIGQGDQFMSRARELLIQEMASTRPKIPTIQGLLILGGRQCAIGNSSEGWLYTGMAIRMILDLGLHLLLRNPYLAELEHLTPPEVEVRKRIYNSAYLWDKTISLALGRPPSLVWAPHDPEDILDHCDDEQEWKPVQAPEIGPSYGIVPSYNTMTFCAHTQLHKITTQMMLLYSNTASRRDLMAEIKNLDNRFAGWYNSLPAPLRMDDVSNLVQSPPPHIVSLNLLYHALYILLYRASLSSPDTAVRSTCLSICLSHAKEVHDKFAVYEKTFPNRLMTYQVSYCVFTAASVDAYAIKNLRGNQVQECVVRLGDAMRVLQQEARHTPGIARTLSTIRRQLATWKPERKQRPPREGNLPLESSSLLDDETQNTHNIHSLQDMRAADIGSRAQDIAQLQLLGEAPQDLFDYFLGGGLPNVTAFSGIDTGAGFHPDAFPWSVVDNSLEPTWN